MKKDTPILCQKVIDNTTYEVEVSCIGKITFMELVQDMIKRKIEDMGQ